MPRRVAIASAAVIAAALFSSAVPAPAVASTVGGSVGWAGRTFERPGELAAWLSGRGADYDAWATRHPGAAARVEGRTAPVPTAPPIAPRRSPPLADASVKTGGTRELDMVAVMVAALGGILLAAAMGPARVLERLGGRLELGERRAAFAGSGAVMLVVLAIVRLL